jgi:hypothetical protein
MNNQLEPFGDAGPPDLGDAALQEELRAERSLVRHVFIGIAVAVPVSIVVWEGLIALAVGGKHPDWPVWLGMAALIGVLTGVFFGTWAGFVSQTHTFEELDHHPATIAVVPEHTAHDSEVADASAPVSDRHQLQAQNLSDVVGKWPGWLLELPDGSEAVPISHVVCVPALHGETRWVVHTAEHPSRRIEYHHPDDPIILVPPP